MVARPINHLFFETFNRNAPQGTLSSLFQTDLAAEPELKLGLREAANNPPSLRELAARALCPTQAWHQILDRRGLPRQPYSTAAAKEVATVIRRCGYDYYDELLFRVAKLDGFVRHDIQKHESVMKKRIEKAGFQAQRRRGRQLDLSYGL